MPAQIIAPPAARVKSLPPFAFGSVSVCGFISRVKVTDDPPAVWVERDDDVVSICVKRLDIRNEIWVPAPSHGSSSYVLAYQLDDFGEGPDVVRDPRLHRRGHPERLVDTGEGILLRGFEVREALPERPFHRLHQVGYGTGAGLPSWTP